MSDADSGIYRDSRRRGQRRAPGEARSRACGARPNLRLVLFSLALAFDVLAVRPLVGLDVLEFACLVANGVELRAFRAAMRGSLCHGRFLGSLERTHAIESKVMNQCADFGRDAPLHLA